MTSARRARGIAQGMILAHLLACTAPDASPDASPAPADTADSGVSPTSDLAAALPAAPGANVVVLFVDTLRADRLPMYGHDRNTLPTTGSEPWVVVEGLGAVSSWTGPTTASSVTGLAPYRHGFTWLSQEEVEAPITARTLFQDLGDAGYATGVFTANGLLGLDTGMAVGADLYYIEGKGDGLRDASHHLAVTMEWIDDLPDGKPFAAWVQPMDMHSPYSPEAQDRGTWSEESLPFSLDIDHAEQEDAIAAAYAADPDRTTEAVRDVYDEQLLGVDRALRTLLDGLEARGLLENTVVVFAADHGESLNDAGDGTFGHFGSLRYELLDVPLMVRHPTGGGARVRCLADSTDLAPTLLALLDVPYGLGADGRALQEGCREAHNAGFWDPLDALEVIAQADRDFQVVRDCRSGAETFHDLRGDAHGVPIVPEAEVPDAAARIAGLDAFAADIAKARPDDACSGKR